MKSENLSNILKSSGFKNIRLDNIIESKYILKDLEILECHFLSMIKNVEWSLRLT